MPKVVEDFHSLALENLRKAKLSKDYFQNCGLQLSQTFIGGHIVKDIFLPVIELLVAMGKVRPSLKIFVNMHASLKKKKSIT